MKAQNCDIVELSADEIELVQGGNVLKKLIDWASRIYTAEQLAEDAADAIESIPENAPYGSDYDSEGCHNQCPW